MSDNKNEEWLTVLEVAKQLRISDESVYRLARTGRLRAVRIGGLWRISADAVREFLAANQQEPLPFGGKM